MNGNPHPPDDAPTPGLPPERPVDAGSQALSEALRSSFAIVKLVMVVLVVAFLFSGFFKVDPQQQAIILRFGKPVGQGAQALLGPGLHWSFPYPIDESVKISITSIQRVDSTVGWFATTPEMEEPPPGPSLNPAVDGYVLTADGNIIHTRARLTYRINDPIRYIFDFLNASNSIQSALDNALLYAAAHFNVDDILTRDVTGFKEAVQRRTTELVEKQNLGVIVEGCQVQSRPPRQLKTAFENVLKAEVKRNQVLSEAHSFENQVLSKASADAESRINLAEVARVRLVNDVSSRASLFGELLPQYRSNSALFVQQRLTETLGRVFTNAADKIFVAEGLDGNSRELRYLFNRELPKPRTEETK